MPITYQDMSKLFAQGLSFSELLPYVQIEQNIVVLSDGSLGAVWELKGANILGKDEQSLTTMIRSLEHCIIGIEDVAMAFQFIVLNYPSNAKSFNPYIEYHQADNLGAYSTNIKIDHLIKHSRQIRHFATLRYFPVWKKTSIINVNTQELESSYQGHMDYFRSCVNQMHESLKSSNLNPTVLEEEDLENFFYQCLHPKQSQETKKPFEFGDDIYLEHLLREKLITSQPVVDRHGIHVDDLKMRIISLKELPMETFLGMLTVEHRQGLPFCLLDGHQYLMLTLNLNIVPQAKAMEQLNFQKSFSFLHQHNWLGDTSIEAKTKNEETNAAIERLYTKGERIVLMRVHAVTMHEQEEMVRLQANKLISDLSRLGAQGILEEIIGASLYLTTLPLNFDYQYDHMIKRFKRVISSNAIDLLPIISDYQGTPTAAWVHLNRRGKIIYLDLFDSQTNPHALVVGASGSGKSFLMNDFIVQHYRLGSYFFVIDKGDSYLKTCRILNGKYVKFDLNNPVTINPFNCALTAENMSFLLSMLIQMASGIDPRDRLTREEEGLLQKAIHEVYKKIDGEVTLSDLIKVLNSNEFNNAFGINSVMGPTLALRLTPFSAKGSYGGFFDGKNNFTLDGAFTVFELGNLSSYPDLQIVVLLNLMFYLTTMVASPELKPKRKYLLIDEAWSLLNVKNSADFIVNAYKTFRKYRASVVSITQEIADLTSQQTGLAIIANTAFKLFLKQDAVLIDALKDKLSFNQPMIDLLKTVTISKGHYSECCVIYDGDCGIIRLYPDPFLYWMANSEAKNNAYLNDLIEQCNGDVANALSIAIKEHPYGLS